MRGTEIRMRGGKRMRELELGMRGSARCQADIIA
jgi:hypothetical protein